MASEIASSPSVEPADRECPVCHEDFTQPKILPCAHLLCRDCLVTWVKSETDARCPLCRCAIVTPEERGSKSCEEVADELPTDLAMAALVESARTLKEKHTCQVCANVPASSICLNCGDLMCSTCAAFHLKMSMLRHHTVEELSKLTAERLTTSRPVACSAHSDELCKLFCPTHGESICHLCAAAKHRACTEVTELQEKLKEAQAVLSDLAVKLSAGENDLERAIKELDQHLKETQQNAQTALADIDAACNRLKTSVETCRRRWKELVLAAKSEVEAIVTGGKIDLVERRGKLTSHKRLVERTKVTSPSSSLGKMSTMLKSRVDGLDFSVKLPESSKLIKEFNFTGDPQTLAQIEEKIAELGTPIVFCFHLNHGKNVTLSNDQQTAETTAGDGFGVVVSHKHMMINRLYEVQMDQTSTSHSCSNNIIIGILTVDPANLNLERRLWDMKTAYSVCHTSVMHLGSTSKASDVGKALGTLGVGDRVGVLVDAAKCLHLYVNGKDQGVVASDVPQPCYATFDLGFYTKKVTALPVKIIK